MLENNIDAYSVSPTLMKKCNYGESILSMALFKMPLSRFAVHSYRTFLDSYIEPSARQGKYDWRALKRNGINAHANFAASWESLPTRR